MRAESVKSDRLMENSSQVFTEAESEADLSSEADGEAESEVDEHKDVSGVFKVERKTHHPAPAPAPALQCCCWICFVCL